MNHRDAAEENKPTPSHTQALLRAEALSYGSILNFVILLQKENVNITRGFYSKLERPNKPRDTFSDSGVMTGRECMCKSRDNALSIRLHRMLCKFIANPSTQLANNLTLQHMFIRVHYCFLSLSFSPGIFSFPIMLCILKMGQT